MNTKKYFSTMIFCAASIAFIFFVFIPASKKINTDFPNYYVSANMLLDGKDLMEAYDNVEFNKQLLLYGVENQFVSFSPYPPVNSLLMVPFARLEPLTAKLFWNFLNILFFILSAYFISKFSGLNFFETGIVFFCSGFAFANNFFFGQAYILVLMCLSGSLYYLSKGKDIPAAALFAFSVLLKFYTVFFLILFLCRKKYRMFFISLALIFFLNLASILITGIDVNSFYYLSIMPRISDGWVGIVYAPEYQSVTSMLHTFFYKEDYLNPNPLSENSRLYFLLKYFFYFAILILSAIFTLSSGKSNLNLQISLFCFVCMLLLPVNASYQYVILIPAIAILCKHYIENKRYFYTGLILALFFIINSPLSVYLINAIKVNSYFFLSYIKLFALLFFWITNLTMLAKNPDQKIKGRIIPVYAAGFIILVLLFAGISQRIYKPVSDCAESLITGPGYMLSMPASFNNKLIFTNCENNKFTLNSDFGLKYSDENVFNPEFSDSMNINYETISEKRQMGKQLNLNSQSSGIVSLHTAENEISYSFDSTLICFSYNNHIYLEDVKNNFIMQLTRGNSFNTRPVFAKNDSRIIFCSDRNRGVGFTALYQIKLKR